MTKEKARDVYNKLTDIRDEDGLSDDLIDLIDDIRHGDLWNLCDWSE